MFFATNRSVLYWYHEKLSSYTDRISFAVLSLKGGCTCSSESRFVKMPHRWKSHVAAHIKYKMT